MGVAFPYLRIILRPSLRALPGGNAAKALGNIEHIYMLKSRLFVEFA